MSEDSGPDDAVHPVFSVDVDEVVRRIREFPPTDLRRWRIVEELGVADQDRLLAEAVRLLESPDPQEVIVGTQILDPWLDIVAHQVDDAANDSGRLPGTDGLVPLLHQAVQPDQDPVLIAEALTPYLRLRPHDLQTLVALLEHPEARVRAAALGHLYGVTLDVVGPADSLAPLERRSVMEILADVLAQETAAEVRREAAARLAGIHLVEEDEHPALAQAAVGYLAPYVEDPDPVVRAEALLLAIRAAPSERVGRFADLVLRELEDPEVDQKLVWSVHSLLPRLDDERIAAVHAALLRLQGSDWPGRTGSPDTYPDVEDREVVLAQQIHDTDPVVVGRQPWHRLRAPRAPFWRRRRPDPA